MFRRLHKEGGFTLLETLIAMVILGVSITILVEAYLTVTNGIEYQRTYNFLTAWSGDKMTELVNGMELARHGSFEHNGREFKWYVEERYDLSEFTDNDTGNGLKKMELIVEWQDRYIIRNYRVSRIVLADF